MSTKFPDSPHLMACVAFSCSMGSWWGNQSTQIEIQKAEGRNCIIFPNGSVWFMENLLCLCDIWKGASYVNVNVSVSSIFNTMVSFILSTTFSVIEIPPWRDSAKYQLLRLYSQFPFIKVLKALQVLMVTAFWRNVSRQTSVTKTSTRRHFRAYLLKFISISLFCQYLLKVDI